MSEHTKAPWIVHDFTELFGDDPRQVTISCTHPDTITVCAMDRALTAEIGEAKANARHIVHCVNNHERMVKMLKEAVSKSRANKMGWIQDAAALLAQLEAGKGGD